MANVDELLDLGRKYHEARQLEHAETIFRQILAQEPQHAEVLQRMAMVAIDGQRGDEALAWFRRAVEVEPANAMIRCNLGAACCTLGRLEEGREVLAEAVRLAPDYYPAHYNLGLVCHRLGRIEEAMANYRGCLQVDSDYYPALRNLGVVLQELGDLRESQRCFERVRDLQPRDPSSHVNLATVLKDQGDLDAALACFDQATALDAACYEARYRRGQLRLSRGEFAAGWSDFEYRVRCAEFDTLRLSEPRWDGAPLTDGTLLIHCEQGLGDTLQFIRYVKLARERCRRVIVAAQPQLVPLLTESGYGPVVSRDEPVAGYDVQAPLLSLPHIVGTELHTIPRNVPYLAVHADRVAAWRGELARYDGRKIGIAWQGQPQYRPDRMRSIPLVHFEPLARVTGVHLIGLQKGHGTEQVSAARERFEIIDLGDRFDAGGAFLDTAAVMQSLDLVVTSDTAIAHLAGALGVQVWVALNAAPDWRWMLEGSECPWYPTMRLFRQQRAGDWQFVFNQMAGELRLS